MQFHNHFNQQLDIQLKYSALNKTEISQTFRFATIHNKVRVPQCPKQFTCFLLTRKCILITHKGNTLLQSEDFIGGFFCTRSCGTQLHENCRHVLLVRSLILNNSKKEQRKKYRDTKTHGKCSRFSFHTECTWLQAGVIQVALHTVIMNSQMLPFL